MATLGYSIEPKVSKYDVIRLKNFQFYLIARA
jgi:hypothetical protein